MMGHAAGNGLGGLRKKGGVQNLNLGNLSRASMREGKNKQTA